MRDVINAIVGRLLFFEVEVDVKAEFGWGEGEGKGLGMSGSNLSARGNSIAEAGVVSPLKVAARIGYARIGWLYLEWFRPGDPWPRGHDGGTQLL